LNKRIFIGVAFAIVTLAQLALPANWIRVYEKTLREGTPYKFRLAVGDPVDPFRGNYLALAFVADSIPVEAPSRWSRGESVHVSFDTTEGAYARLMDVSQDPLSDGLPSFQSQVEFVHQEPDMKRGWLNLEHPFDRYFLKKKKAEKVQELLRSGELGQEGPNYAQVRVLNGKAVLERVVIDGRPIEEQL
jgi:uncharacterized membrane-anchored protein